MLEGGGMLGNSHSDSVIKGIVLTRLTNDNYWSTL